MADIFDLARNINRQKQQATQGYNSPLEDLPMQVMQIMDTRAKEKRVSLKNDSVILNQLISGATNQGEIDNILKITEQYGIDTSSDPETKLYGDLISQKAIAKADAYNQFQASAEWVDTQLSKEGGMEYFEMSEEELMKISPEELSKRMDEIIDFSGGMKEGLSNKFKYKKGAHSLDKMNKTFADYEQKLENAISANITGKMITQEEAMAIMLGDFEGAKKTAKATIKANVSNYNGQLKVLRKERMDIKTAMAEGSAGVAQYAVNTGTDASGVQARLAELDKDISTLDSALALEYDRQYYWTGIGKKGGLESLAEHGKDDGKDDGKDGGTGDTGFDHKTASVEEIKAMQKKLGVTVDGIWGDESQKAFTESQEVNPVGTGLEKAFNEANTPADIVEEKVVEKVVKEDGVEKVVEKVVKPVERKPYRGSKIGEIANTSKFDALDILEPYKDSIKETIDSNPSLKEHLNKTLKIDTSQSTRKLKNDLRQINHKIKSYETARQRGQAKEDKKRLAEWKKEKAQTESKIESGYQYNHHDLFSLLISGQLKLEQFGVPEHKIIGIKKALKNYKLTINQVSPRERRRNNLPEHNNINLDF